MGRRGSGCSCKGKGRGVGLGRARGRTPRLHSPLALASTATRPQGRQGSEVLGAAHRKGAETCSSSQGRGRARGASPLKLLKRDPAAGTSLGPTSPSPTYICRQPWPGTAGSHGLLGPWGSLWMERPRHQGMAKNTYMRWRLPLVCLLWEVAMIVLFGVFVRFGPEADAHWEEEKREMNLTSDIENDFYFRYPCEYSGSVVVMLAGPHPIHPSPAHRIHPSPAHGRACQR